MFLKSSVSLKQEIKYSRIIDFIRILYTVDEEIKKHGENAIFCASPQRGKNAWTYKEFKEAVIADKPLENGGETTPIDDYLNFERYKTEHHNGKNT